MALNERELEILKMIKDGLNSDLPMMSFGTDKYFSEEFLKENEGVTFMEAPLNEPLVVVSSRLTPFYYENGIASCALGSVIVKESDSQVNFIDAYDWLKIHGFKTREVIVGKYEVKDDPIGEVLRLKDVKIPDIY